MTPPATGKLYGVGTGPGDPELLTLKAARVLSEAHVVAHFAKAGNASNARRIVEAHARPDWIELPLLYPVTTEVERHHDDYRGPIAGFYETSAARLAEHLDQGRTVAVLSEGDPLFYGSYMHLHVRLAHRYPTEVIAGVTAMSGCWSQAGVPITQGDDVLSVLPGTLDEDELVRRLSDSQAAVIMKVGRNLAKIRRALVRAGKLELATYVERGTMPNTQTARLADKADDTAPYFAIVLVPGWSERR
ncbi:MAG: precorrin-2 C(20)-methyltransferase [Rhizobiaceae bacterium]